MIIQFAVCEATYRIGMAMDEFGSGSGELFYDVSNAVSWPAVILYEMEDAQENIRALREYPAETLPDEDGKPVNLKELANKIEADNSDFDSLDLAYSLLSEQEIYPEVPIATEYLIYGGVCLIWGVVMGSLTTFLILVNRERNYSAG
ncbi:hypothetical protein [Cerasicoccus maritimus]|uniref:hypothetical protein n=1 Tax=Cerasicoccus maritimus TaxID=490089 RepID=UPI002852952D|nr:hypothetical protein [Cerasicoccus maritimus]